MSDAPGPPAQSSIRQILAPPPLVGLAAWLIPGSGYLLIGQRARGLTVGITILLLFVCGLLIGGVRVVDAPSGHTFQKVLQKPWFIPQILAGPVAVAADYTASHWGSHTDSSTGVTVKGAPVSTARVNEIGTLYTAVAGLLNLMAIIDSAFRAGNEGGR